MKMLFLQRAQKLLIVCPVAVFFLFCAATARSQTNDYEFNDRHFHLTNNVQEGPSVRDFLNMMGNRVGRATLFGVPLQQEWLYGVDGDRTIPALASADLATTVSDFQIEEWPRNLRTDLKRSSIRVVLPENAPDRPWNDALMAKFRELTGIEVQTIRPGNDTSAVLSSYLREFETGSPRADVYAIDIVWPGILSDYAEDLRPAFDDMSDMVPGLVENNTVHGKLVAVPYFVEISLLYYRRDLLEKYHFVQPPRTWNELEQQAKVIAKGERASGRGMFWGFLWQGAASEALTCNALEWQISQSGGSLLKPDGRVSLERAPMVQALERARRCRDDFAARRYWPA